jgi:hypothetical protein
MKSDNYNMTVKEDIVNLIIKRYAEGKTCQQVMKEFNISSATAVKYRKQYKEQLAKEGQIIVSDLLNTEQAPVPFQDNVVKVMETAIHTLLDLLNDPDTAKEIKAKVSLDVVNNFIISKDNN